MVGNVHHLDFQIFKTTQIFIVVILFGAVTDYCLFLIARYREELQHGLEPRAALEEALGQTGHALTASAMTTILGLGAMLLRPTSASTVPAVLTIAISLVVALAACMTVAPALLRAMGRMVFWPFGVGGSMPSASEGNRIPTRSASEETKYKPKLKRGSQNIPRSRVGLQSANIAVPTLMGRLWTVLARQIVAYPGLILVASFFVLAVPAWYRLQRADHLRHAGRAVARNARASRACGCWKSTSSIGETETIGVLAYWRGGNFDMPAESGRRSPSWRWSSTTSSTKTAIIRHKPPIDHIRCLTNPLGDSLRKDKIHKSSSMKSASRPPTTRRASGNSFPAASMRARSRDSSW